METPHVFGKHEHLFGIHTDARFGEDSAKAFPHRDTAVIMLTAGMLSHVGPSRLHVSLAEALKQDGISSFRFDLSGIGESLPIGGQGASIARAIGEVQQAMDFLQAEYAYTRFLLFGLCSGADDAVAAALQDNRIVAVSALDGCAYPTMKHFIRSSIQKYLPKVISPEKWISLVRNWVGSEQAKVASMPFGSDIREFPAREQAERELLSLANRGVSLQFLYTGGAIDDYSYERQFHDMFPSLRQRREISVHYQPSWDHVAILEEDRIELIATLKRWFAEKVSKLQAEQLAV